MMPVHATWPAFVVDGRHGALQDADTAQALNVALGRALAGIHARISARPLWSLFRPLRAKLTVVPRLAVPGTLDGLHTIDVSP